MHKSSPRSRSDRTTSTASGRNFCAIAMTAEAHCHDGSRLPMRSNHACRQRYRTQGCQDASQQRRQPRTRPAPDVPPRHRMACALSLRATMRPRADAGLTEPDALLLEANRGRATAALTTRGSGNVSVPVLSKTTVSMSAKPLDGVAGI